MAFGDNGPTHGTLVPPAWALGELAQLVERCDRTAEVRGSSPLFSTLDRLNAEKSCVLSKLGQPLAGPTSDAPHWGMSEQHTKRC